MAIESPVARQAMKEYRAIKGKTRMLVAEHVDNLELDDWRREGLLDAWIVAAPKVGNHLQRLARLAAEDSRPIWVEHRIDNGIAQVFQAHQAAAWPSIQYCISVTNVLADDCMNEPFTVRNGQYEVPTKAGLGVTLDEDAVEKYRIA